MALSGNQFTVAGGLGGHAAYAGFSAKVETDISVWANVTDESTTWNNTSDESTMWTDVTDA